MTAVGSDSQGGVDPVLRAKLTMYWCAYECYDSPSATESALQILPEWGSDSRLRVTLIAAQRRSDRGPRASTSVRTIRAAGSFARVPRGRPGPCQRSLSAPRLRIKSIGRDDATDKLPVTRLPAPAPHGSMQRGIATSPWPRCCRGPVQVLAAGARTPWARLAEPAAALPPTGGGIDDADRIRHAPGSPSGPRVSQDRREQGEQDGTDPTVTSV